MTYQWRDLMGSVVGGKYMIGDYLGEGGGVGVFTTETSDGPAIVRIAPGNRFANQWSTAVTLSHPHIIRSYASGTFEVDEDIFDYLVSERPDDSLSDVVADRALTEEEARAVLGSVLQATVYLHSQGLTHGAIVPENIVAVGDSVKLSPWTISRSGAPADDMVQVGESIVEILTQRKPLNGAQARVLPAPFDRVAERSLLRRLTAAEALEVLHGREMQSTPTVRRRVPTAALVAVFAAVVLFVFWLRSSSRNEIARAPVAEATTVPAPVTRGRAVEPTPTPAAPQRGNWVVVGAIYKDYPGALKRAEQISQRWKMFQPEVFPPEGQGRRRYMVVLGSADSRKEAERLLAKARSAGMPRDAYVTRIDR
jgi:serine/threonine protein kinase